MVTGPRNVRSSWPYDYSNPGHDEDFVPQTVPMKPGEEVLHHNNY
jgi:hypothetical protein